MNPFDPVDEPSPTALIAEDVQLIVTQLAPSFTHAHTPDDFRKAVEGFQALHRPEIRAIHVSRLYLMCIRQFAVDTTILARIVATIDAMLAHEVLTVIASMEFTGPEAGVTLADAMITLAIWSMAQPGQTFVASYADLALFGACTMDAAVAVMRQFEMEEGIVELAGPPKANPFHLQTWRRITPPARSKSNGKSRTAAKFRRKAVSSGP